MKIKLLSLFTAAVYLLCGKEGYVHAELSQSDESIYLANFDSIIAASYSAVDDPTRNTDSSVPIPDNLLNECKKGNYPSITPVDQIIVDIPDGDPTISSTEVGHQCSENSICVIPSGLTIQMDSFLNVGALIIEGNLDWSDDTQQSDPNTFLCAGYIAVEKNGSFQMNLQNKNGWIYIKDNGAVHPVLRSRAFGGVVPHNSHGSDYPIIDITGRDLIRTWSVLSQPLSAGDTTMSLVHDPSLMSWRVGDRIAISPTQPRSTGFAQEFRILDISDGLVTLSEPALYDFDSEFYYHPVSFPSIPTKKASATVRSAEVINLERNIIITGDDFAHIPCDNTLGEAVPGEQTSVEGCRCASFRNTCTVGLHTAQMHGGVVRIQNVRVEKCGQRGIEGKYCLHLHKMEECEECLYRNNVIENSQQRGIIVHGTHLSTVESNVLYNVRGSGIYLEDGNEMHNHIEYNVVICPFPFRDVTLHGCTIPGTSNRVADTSDNQAAFFSRAATNNFIGNRASNAFNGMFLQAGGIGRGSSYDKVCEQDAKLGRYAGNVFHGSGRFGTYTLGFNYPKETDQSISTNGHNANKDLCKGFDLTGNTRGKSAAFYDHLDYHNAFVGHYEAGDIQYNGHRSFDNNNLIYWKETKNFENGCSAHLAHSHYSGGNMALPDQGTIIIEETVFDDGVSLEPNHHCNVGLTGILCQPQYVLHNVKWQNSNTFKKWVEFQHFNTQGHIANQHHGGIFTLSPPNADFVMSGSELESSFFPPGYVSLCSNKFPYLISSTKCDLSNSVLPTERAYLYDNGIICKVPLRSLKIYSRGLVSNSAPGLKVDVWHNNLGLAGQTGAPDGTQIINFHQIGGDNESRKQGYSLPVIEGLDQSYHISLAGGGDIPSDWVIEYSDTSIGNRWKTDYLYLGIQGRSCGSDGLISSQHDRRFIWSGDEFMNDLAWENHGACTGTSQPDMPYIDCSTQQNGHLEPTECPDLCDEACPTDRSYCDCGSRTCRCKEGFTGTDCKVDLCAAAHCTDHGACSALYFGGKLPTQQQACVCDDGYSGYQCQFNVCLESGETCSGNGKCYSSGLEAKCKCNEGYSGEHCEISCNDHCEGSYPYGCAPYLDGVIKYGCNSGNPTGCHYLRNEDEEYPSDDFCTYKVSEVESCSCVSNNDCEIIGSCLPDDTCPDPVILEDGTPCNSVPFGTCQDGSCVYIDNSPEPVETPSLSPSVHPSKSSMPTLTQSHHPSTTPSTLPSSIPTDIPLEGTRCGCPLCTDLILNKYAGDFPVRDRIDWVINSSDKNEGEACDLVCGIEFPLICGECNPSECNEPDTTPSPVTPIPTYIPYPPAEGLYCFPNEDSRIRFENVWDDFTIEIKERNEACGPGNNFFSRETVSLDGNELTLRFQFDGVSWKASEVRVISGSGDEFSYGSFSFGVKSVSVKSSALGTVLSEALPADLVLGLFTWDPTDRYDVHQNYNHEVDIEVSQWGNPSNPDMQFLMQPPGNPQLYRFWSDGSGGLNQYPHTHSFEWVPGKITWQSSSGGGQSHMYSTESAVIDGRIDYVQCLPADLEVRMNLWNMHGNAVPNGMSIGDYVEVVIDNFSYTESDIKFIESGEYCSKHCQCEAARGCVNAKCIDVPEEPTGFPTTTPSTMPSLNQSSKPSFFPSSNLSSIPSSNPSSGPSLNPSSIPSPDSACVDSKSKVNVTIGDRTWNKYCSIHKKKGHCSHPKISRLCPVSCNTCDDQDKNPSEKPSTAPSPSADPPCVDPEGRVRVTIGDTKWNKPCSTHKRKGHCSHPKIKLECPVSCETCDSGGDAPSIAPSPSTIVCGDDPNKISIDAQTWEDLCSWHVTNGNCGVAEVYNACTDACAVST